MAIGVMAVVGACGEPAAERTNGAGGSDRADSAAAPRTIAEELDCDGNMDRVLSVGEWDESTPARAERSTPAGALRELTRSNFPNLEDEIGAVIPDQRPASRGFWAEERADRRVDFRYARENRQQAAFDVQQVGANWVAVTYAACPGLQ